MTKYGRALVKPATKKHKTTSHKELEFYESLDQHPGFKKHVPLFHGTLKSTQQPEKPNIVLENISRRFMKPNILDLKLGRVLRPPDILDAKYRKKFKDRARGSTS